MPNEKCSPPYSKCIVCSPFCMLWQMDPKIDSKMLMKANFPPFSKAILNVHCFEPKKEIFMHTILSIRESMITKTTKTKCSIIQGKIGTCDWNNIITQKFTK